MVGPESTLFAIHKSNGKITTKSGLDYETKKSYQFQVVASDSGQPMRKGISSVTVNIVDVNDNAPVFSGSYRARVPENASRGTNVVTVKASDRDSGPRGEVRYSIVSGNVALAFAINELSGLISVKSQLDRETR